MAGVEQAALPARQESVLEMTVMGPTVRELARSLRTQPGHVTKPRPVTVDGYRSLYLDVQVTRRRSPPCYGGGRTLFRAAPDPGFGKDPRRLQTGLPPSRAPGPGSSTSAAAGS